MPSLGVVLSHELSIMKSGLSKELDKTCLLATQKNEYISTFFSTHICIFTDETSGETVDSTSAAFCKYLVGFIVIL